jgi:ribonuclease HII
MPSKKSSTPEPAGSPGPIRVRAKRSASGAQARLPWDPIGLMAGVDEAGRGPLAGPVVAAAVILDDKRRIRGLADSKVLTPLKRERLYDQIREKALCCSVAQASVEEIDTLNILWATMLAMKRAVEGLRLKPAKVLVDGNRLPVLDIFAEAVIGGDAIVKSISAASILAKVHRDRLCLDLHEEFPQYGFAAHKGYATPEHLEALRVHGACRHHRKFFSPVAATFVLAEGEAAAFAIEDAEVEAFAVEDAVAVTVAVS